MLSGEAVLAAVSLYAHSASQDTLGCGSTVFKLPQAEFCYLPTMQDKVPLPKQQIYLGEEVDDDRVLVCK